MKKKKINKDDNDFLGTDFLKNDLKDFQFANNNELVEITDLFEFHNKNLSLYLNKFKYRFFRNYNIIVNMELINGEQQIFYVKANYNGFLFRGKRYIIDTTYKYYSQSFKNYVIDFHEEFCLPIDRKVKVKQIRNDINNKELEIKNMLNPYILEQFVKSSLAEGILAGSSISDMMKKLMWWIIISAVAGSLGLIFALQQSGILSQLKL